MLILLHSRQLLRKVIVNSQLRKTLCNGNCLNVRVPNASQPFINNFKLLCNTNPINIGGRHFRTLFKQKRWYSDLVNGSKGKKPVVKKNSQYTSEVKRLLQLAKPEKWKILGMLELIFCCCFNFPTPGFIH